MARFTHRTAPFGIFTQHIIEHEGWGFKCVLVAEFGAHLLELKLAGQDILEGYKTPAELSQNKWYKNSFLFPFPNRLAEGRYTWNGETYEFPLDDGLNGHALHGFGTDKSFDFFKKELTDKRAVFSCTYTDEGDHPGYPFPFTFRITFTVDTTDELKISLAFTNHSATDIPLGLGWHPYFSLGTRIDDISMTLPTCNLIGVNARMLPTGKRYPFDDFASPTPIRATVLDNCFALVEEAEKTEVWLENQAGRLVFWQDSGSNGFRFLQVFTPFYRDAIAIEPMTCNIDAFNSGEGLIRLPAGETWAAGFGIQFHPAT